MEDGQLGQNTRQDNFISQSFGLVLQRGHVGSVGLPQLSRQYGHQRTCTLNKKYYDVLKNYVVSESQKWRVLIDVEDKQSG